VTPSPHHPIGAKGVGESPNVGGVSAFSNAVVDAFAHLGVTQLPTPHTASRLWRVCHEHGLTGLAAA
jgi:carbon-monoxide dehydrogenase large subunit